MSLRRSAMLLVLTLAFHFDSFAITYYSVSGSFSLVVADINHDGKADILTVSGASVSVLLNAGNGTFLPHVDYPVDPQTLFMATADFNNDGNLDLVTETGATGGVIDLLLGNGDGTFQPATSFVSHCGIDPRAIVTGDFNGDGMADFATGNLGPRKLGMFFGNGQGGFNPGPCNTAPASDIVPVDINGDGKLDLVGTNASSQAAPYGLSTLLGNADGTFQSQSFGFHTALQSPQLIDLNGDGKLDVLAMSAPSGFAVSVINALGNRDGTFSNPKSLAAHNLRAFRADLFHQNAFPGLVAETNRGVAFTLTFFEGSGDGTFKVGNSYQIPSFSSMILSADLDGDGNIDLVGSLPNDSRVYVYYGNGDGTFR